MENKIISQDESIVVDERGLQNASALLALLHGKSDSICRLFHREISVNKADLRSLNELMVAKLSLHNVSTVTTTIDISFTNKRILSFKSWPEFEAYNFDLQNAATKSVFIQWDFFASFNGFQVPQRHTVNVRIASTPNPSDFFKALLGGGFDEAEDFEIQSCTMVCKVDFVNNTLAEELIHVAEKWNEGTENACSKNGKFRCFLAKHRNGLALTFEYMLLISCSLLLAVLWKAGVHWNLFSNSIHSLIYLLIALLPIGKICRNGAHAGGRKIYDSFSNLLNTHIFMISKGDSKAQERIKESSKFGKEVTLFVINAFFSIALSYVFYLLG